MRNEQEINDAVKMLEELVEEFTDDENDEGIRFAYTKIDTLKWVLGKRSLP